MAKIIVIFIILMILYYVLYINGYMILTSKRAMMFIGTQRGKEARFTVCTGYIRRVIKFEESREYEFTFNAELSKGNVSVELLDASKKRVLFLKENRCGKVSVEAGKRYYLMIRFESSTGSYQLDWS